jgi:hypothetical protein
MPLFAGPSGDVTGRFAIPGVHVEDECETRFRVCVLVSVPVPRMSSLVMCAIGEKLLMVDALSENDDVRTHDAPVS